MISQTKYSYQKRIKDLESQLASAKNDLYQFRTACLEIYDGLILVLKDNKNISIPWILEKFKRAWRP